MRFAGLDLRELVLESVQSPRTAARRVIDLDLPRTAIWSLLALAAALNAILATVSQAIFPPTIPLPTLMTAPLSLFFVLAGGLVVMVHALVWAGRAMGGETTLEHMGSAIAWLQMLRVLAQAVVLVLSFIHPALGGLFALAVMIWGIWMLINFVTEALSFASAFQGFGVLVAVTLGLVLGLTLLLTLTGVTFVGLQQNV